MKSLIGNFNFTNKKFYEGSKDSKFLVHLLLLESVLGYYKTLYKCASALVEEFYATDLAQFDKKTMK